MNCEKVKYLPFGDRALVVEFGDKISPEISCKVRGLFMAARMANIPGIISMIPTYRSLLVEYSPLEKSYSAIAAALQALEDQLETLELPRPDIITVPTLYGGEMGADIENVMVKNSLSEQEVIDIHSGTDYLIYMLGFTPGFPYLGGLDSRLETPRLTSPRAKIAAGSVGIADKQTGIYSVESPGGWQIIGHTPIKVYDPQRENPVLYKAGDYIRFMPVDKSQYNRIAQEVAEGSYQYGGLNGQL